MELAIECHNLVKTYPGRPPVEAVRGIDVAMQVGECFGVLGPNGAGKTTTIEVLEGLLAPTSGEVRVLGRDWRTDAAEIRERIGISLQETRLSDKLTVLETLKLFRSFYQTSLSAEEAMERVSLESKANTWVKRLSGGQRQRLAVATALVGEPELIFLDEPTTGLDPQSRRQLWEIIRDYRNRGRSVLLTTHYMDEAERLCDRVAIVDRGKIIALGSPAELIRQVGGEHVVEFSVNEHQAMSITVEELQALPSVSTVQLNSDHALLTVKSPHLTIPALLTRLQRDQLEFKSLTTRHASLEDVFVSLTGRSLVEEDELVTE